MAVGVLVKRRKKFKVTTDSNHVKPLFDNVLDRDFAPNGSDQAYVQDITYIWTQEGWLYLATVIDLYSRRIVGWSMGSRMTAQLVCDALTMAIWQRQPKAGLIVHSDGGSQYASKAYRRLLKAHDFVGSMSRGSTGHNELYYDVVQLSLRLHSYLGYKSPNQFEIEMKMPRLELKKAS